MKSAFVRLAIISFTCLFLVFMALFWLRYLGFHQQYAPINHPLMQSLPWMILKTPETHNDRAEIPKWIENEVKTAGYWAWLDLRRSKDGRWIVAPLEWVEKDGFKQAIHTLSFEDVKSHWPNGVPIEFSEVLEMTPDIPLLLNVIEKDVFWHTEFVNLIPENRSEQIVVRSPMKTFGKKVRELRPEFLFASDLSTLSQYLMFEGVFLETVGGLWSDVFLAPPTYRGRKIFNERMVAELKRRHLPIVIDFESIEELDALPENLPIQGLATRSPAFLKRASSKLLRSSP